MMKANEIQYNPEWGLDRIDDLTGLDGTFEFNYSGKNIHVYVVDTGIYSDHNEFSGRVGNGFSAVRDGRGSEDCNGHGTHVAGTIAGQRYGVAKDAIVHAVRVLNCRGSGSTSGVVSGLSWVLENAQRPAVVNMSLGGPRSRTLDRAIERLTSAGINVVVAAGNDSSDACNYSPSAVSSALTVGSSNRNDNRSSFSNYGRCLDLFAPGERITSAWIGEAGSNRTTSGTSMASPHVAGVAALYLEADRIFL